MSKNVLDEVNKAQIELIYDSRVYTSVFMALASLLVYALMSSYIDAILLYWLIYMLLADVYRVVVTRRYNNARINGRLDIVAALNALYISTVLSSVGWGLCGVILFPSLDVINKLILSNIIIGVATASTMTLSYKKDLAYLFLLFSLAPLGATVLFVGGETLIVAVLLVVYFAFLVKNVSVFYQNNRQLLELEFTAVEREHEFEQQKKNAVQANAIKSEFLANISHELRTPMHSILGFSELGINRIETAPKEKLLLYYTRIQTSGQRLLGLLNNLLDISKLEAGRMDLDKGQHDIRKSIDMVTEELTPLFVERCQIMDYIIDSQETTATYDNDKIIQVIRNLLSNAIKFSKRNSHITIRICDAELTIDNDGKSVPAISISVADQGNGVPEEDLELIFDKFVQSRKVDNVGGTGLGLSICQEIIALHRGSIKAFNQSSGGATFRFIIPR